MWEFSSHSHCTPSTRGRLCSCKLERAFNLDTSRNCSRVRTVSSVPREECVVSSHAHRAPSAHTGQAFNSMVRLTGSEMKMTNGPMRATVHPCQSSSCRNNLQQPVAPRRQGRWVPSPSRTGVVGAPPLSAIPTLVREYLFVAVGPLSLRDASPGSESSPSSDGQF